MKRLRGLMRLILLLPLVLPAPTFALASDHSGVMIVELQTTGANNATSEEFVELYNTSSSAVDISAWKLQYLSAGGATWQTKATLNGFIYPNGRVLIAASGYLDHIADITYSSGFKLEAGHVRIMHPDTQNSNQEVVEDLVGWGTALHPEGEAATYAPAGNSLVRKMSNGRYVDTDNNKSDFELNSTPTPESDNQEPIAQVVNNDQEVPDPDTANENSPELTDASQQPITDTQPVGTIQNGQSSEETAAATTMSGIEITELLPDPASPATDANDEYIELHNTTDQAIELDGFKLQTGNSYSYSYTIQDKVLLPHSYIVLYSSKTGLILSNTGGRARLISPSGEVISETDSYINAKPGQTWSFVNGVWAWSTTQTAGGDNVLTVPVTSTQTTTTKTAKPKTTKVPVTKKKTTAKPKTAAAKKEKKTAAVQGATTSNGGDAGPSSAPIHTWIIAALGLLALGYAIYEYKDDIANKFRRFRTNRANSRKPRTAP